MKDNALKGCGKVFSFSLKQLLKSKGNIITIIIMCIGTIISMPLVGMSHSPGLMPSDTVCEASDICIVNKSGIQLEGDTGDAFVSYFSGDYYKNVEIIITGTKVEDVKDSEIVFVISDSTDDNNNGQKINVTSITSPQSTVPQKDIDRVSNDFKTALNKILLKNHGVTDAQIDLLFSGVSVSTMYYSEYADTFDEDAFMEKFIYQYIYSIIVLMICSLSISYIVRAVIEEKASKLVELLMISVKPLSLIVGKILAIMVYVIIMIASVAASFFISFGISNSMSGFTPSSLLAIVLPSGNISFDPINVVVIIVSVFIAYVTMSLIAGLLGTACSSSEDMQSANLASTMLLLSGYLVSSVITATDSTAIALFSSLCPIISIFCAPVNFMLGAIDGYILIISWIIQLIILAIISLICGRVYKELIVYNGKRLKLTQIIKMAFSNGGRSK